MNLEEFIKSVVVGIDRGVDAARNDTKRDIRLSDRKDQRTLEFDIAVSAEEVDSKSGKAGIKVLQFAEGGGEISKENKNSTVSRIQFGIHIDPLTREESAQRDAEWARINAENRRSTNDFM